MNHLSSRAYRRHKRKLACRYCSARHIKCRSPEPSSTGPHQRNRSRRCQACLHANIECEPGRAANMIPSDLSADLYPTDSNGSRQVPPGGRELSAGNLFDGQSLPFAVQLPNPSADLQDSARSPREQSSTRASTDERPKEGSEMLLAHLMDTEEHENRSRTKNIANNVVYFGNDSIWSWTIRQACDSNAQQRHSPESISTRSTPYNIHYQIPNTLDKRPHDVPEDDLDLKQEEMNLLRKKGAFSLPPLPVQKALLDAYFRWMFPMQQILDREQFLQDFEAGRASILLLQALFFVATTCCDDDIIKENWGSRRSAQLALFKRVKALYDADYEQNRVTVVQVLFLMTFWWGSPTDEKDFSHWLAVAVQLAQTNGMHRSTKYSYLSQKDQKLWKRIWWTFYVRDHFDAASLGRPMLIHDDDCDVEPLEVSDFEDAANTGADDDNSRMLGVWHSIEMARLAILLGEIIRATQKSNNTHAFRKEMDAKLSAWLKSLPERLKYHEDETNQEAKLLASMLSLGFYWCKILLHRQIFLEATSEHDVSVAPASANAVTRIVEDLLAEGLFRRASVHLIAILFACLTIHVIQLRQSDGARRRVLQHKLQLCVLALAEFKDYWPFVGWMYWLFRKLLERLRVEDKTSDQGGPDYHARNSHSRSMEADAFMATQHEGTATEHELATMPTSRGGMDPRSVRFWTAANPAAETTSGSASFEEFLDPFSSLDAMQWADFQGEPFGSLALDDLTWPFPPSRPDRLP